MLNLTPFELHFGCKSFVSHLRPFGCKCFVLKRGSLDKFGSHSSYGILFGYTPHDRSYRVFNLKTNTSAPRIVWTSMWSVHALRFGPHHARRCPVAWAHVPEQSSRRLAKGELPQAAPRHTLWARLGPRALCRARAARRRGRAPWAGLAGHRPHRSCPVQLCGQAMAGRARTVSVVHAKVLAQWPV
jgi:hypothetical protein